MGSNIHNIVVCGHGTCGKTTLVEELLARAKAIPRAGRVADKTSILDHEPDERERGFTIDTSTAFLEKDGRVIQFIDTPGYPDFLSNTIDTFAVVETALIAIDAVQGIRVNTRRVWEEAGKAGLARMIIITRLDAENARFDELLAQIRETFGRQCVPLFIPDQAGPGISQIENTFEVDDSSSDRARELHAQLVENVVEVREDLLERYLAEEKIGIDEIKEVFVDAVLQGAVVPVLCVSVDKDIGVNKTLDLLLKLTPVADALVPRAMVDKDGEPVEAPLAGGENDPLVARVFKIVVDPFVGKLSYLRIFSGHMTPNMPIHNLTRDAKERTTNLIRMQGKEQHILEKAGPGAIIAIPKLESLAIGDIIGDPAVNARPAPFTHPVPMVKLAVEPKNRNDETKVTQALKKFAEGDTGFSVERVKTTKELVIAGRSTLHLDIVLARLKSRYKLEVDSHVPRTSYLESIQASAEGHHRHKKQTGGRGQFGEVYVRLEPTNDDSEEALEFNNAIVGGVIPGQFIPAVEKGIREILEHGILAACPIINCKVTLYDGSFHQVDSSEMAFKTAGREAFKKAFLAANPCLLEPILDMEIHVPSQFMGDITGDVNSRRGRIQGIDTDGDSQVIRAQVPESEVKVYSTQLRSLTGGEGSYSVEFSHYEIVPSNVQQRVISEIQKAAAESS